MTRKQALTFAIQLLSERGDCEDVIAVLELMRDELPLNHWSEAAIIDSVEQFILDHGRPPTVTDFKKGGMPPHTVIKRRFNVSLKEWLDQNYPQRHEPLEVAHAKATEEFIQEYLRICPFSSDDYNARRKKNTHCWFTIARYNNTRRWTVLLSTLGLPVYRREIKPEDLPEIKVHIINDYDFRD